MLQIMSVKLELRDDHPQSLALAPSVSLKAKVVDPTPCHFVAPSQDLPSIYKMPVPTSSQPGTLHIIIHSKEKITPALKAPATNQRKESIIGWPNSMSVMRVAVWLGT